MYVFERNTKTSADINICLTSKCRQVISEHHGDVAKAELELQRARLADLRESIWVTDESSNSSWWSSHVMFDPVLRNNNEDNDVSRLHHRGCLV